MSFILKSMTTRLPFRSLNRAVKLRLKAELSEEEVQRRIRKTRNLIRYWERLVPSDKQTFNGAKALWDCLEDVPKEKRPLLLPLLNSRDIKRIWRIAADRYKDSQPTNPQLIEFPEEPHEIMKFEGRIATPILWFGIGSYCKRHFFVEEENFEILGRAGYPLDTLIKTIYPLYFRVNPKSGRIPATGEIYEFSLEYLKGAEAPVQLDTPPLKAWPTPVDPIFPFHGGLTEYLRPIGPGCYVGSGWKAPRPQFNDLGRKFVTFILFKTAAM